MAKKSKNPVITVVIGHKVLENVELVNAGPKKERFVHLSSRSADRWQLLHSDVELFSRFEKSFCVTIARECTREGIDTRALEVVGTGKRAALSLVTRLNLPNHRFIHLDELPNGTWRFSYSTAVITDTRSIMTFNFLADDPLGEGDAPTESVTAVRRTS